MEHKVGQRVKIKSLDWYKKNRDIHGNIECGDALMNIKKSQFCGKIVTISSISDVTDTYKIEEDNGQYIWTDEMIEGLAEEESTNYSKVIDGDMSNPIIAKISLATTDTDKGFYSYSDSDGNLEMEWNLPEGYIFKDENGNVINATKIVLEKKKKEYPKTYEECCKVLGVDPDNYLTIRNVHCYDGEEETIKYEKDLLDKFDSLWELRICRDAYWKIAGEEMGLGKPWAPDWTDQELLKYCIASVGGQIKTTERYVVNTILAFPTPEMRDAFKKNFDPDIEFCKELL